jgi:molecular chaperone DnaK (HSP70)
MGTQKNFPQAPEGFKNPLEISAIILNFLCEASQATNPNKADRTIVTVPASFQTAQRTDTLKAAEKSGIKIEGGDLLDEPVAAFLCYAIEQRGSLELEEGKNQNLLVFDFGGGTCDVAIFALCKKAGQFNLSLLSVSRYHRLGGGDIDRAILYEILLPQILEQNNLSEFDLEFEDKKLILEPAFIGLAESLKVGLCKQINRLKSFNHMKT